MPPAPRASISTRCPPAPSIAWRCYATEASAQYGSDAIAGVVNLVIKDGQFAPFANADSAGTTFRDYPSDGNTVNVNGGWGLKLGRGSLGLFAEYRESSADEPCVARGGGPARGGRRGRVSTTTATSSPRTISVDQPNHHLGDGLANDFLSVREHARAINAAARASSTASAVHRIASAQGMGSIDRDFRPQLAADLSQGIPPRVPTDGARWSAASGFRGEADTGNYDGTCPSAASLRLPTPQTLNLTRPMPHRASAHRGLDGILGNATIRAFPTARTSSPAGCAR
jgi:outer membrane receptor protein involved in Fe transport